MNFTDNNLGGGAVSNNRRLISQCKRGISKKNNKEIRKLLEQGADPNSMDTGGNEINFLGMGFAVTPLLVMCELKNVVGVEMLLEFGVNVNQEISNKYSEDSKTNGLWKLASPRSTPYFSAPKKEKNLEILHMIAPYLTMDSLELVHKCNSMFGGRNSFETNIIDAWKFEFANPKDVQRDEDVEYGEEVLEILEERKRELLQMNPRKRKRMDNIQSSRRKRKMVEIEERLEKEKENKPDPEMTSFILKVKLQEQFPIWRRVKVPSTFDLWQLHKIIQLCFGWKSIDGEYHLHKFVYHGQQYGESHPMADYLKDEIQFKISDLLYSAGDKMTYEYDFGSTWTHYITLEKMVEDESQEVQCIKGKGSTPPEDSPGVGYMMENPDRLEWAKNQNHYSEKFDKNGINGDHWDLTLWPGTKLINQEIRRHQGMFTRGN